MMLQPCFFSALGVFCTGGTTCRGHPFTKQFVVPRARAAHQDQAVVAGKVGGKGVAIRPFDKGKNIAGN